MPSKMPKVIVRDLTQEQNPWRVTRVHRLELDDLAGTCNTLQRDGYEVVQVLPVVVEGTTTEILIFSRRKP